MQVAVLRFVPDDKTSSMDYVELISAVHIGEKDYYQTINQRFTAYDAVLYELVAPRGTRISKGEKEHKSIVSNLQSGMRNVLGMSMQLEEVDYTVGNLVHADLSPEEFRESMVKRNESVSGMIGKAWLVGLGQQYSRKSIASEMRFFRNLMSGNRELAVKIFAAEQMVQSLGMGEAIEGSEGSTLVSERNKKALQVLRQEIDSGKKTLAIFYGAAHMKDIAERLVSEFHFKPVKVEWMDAWRLQ
jgi:pheromone shutdown protein TraB